MVKRVSEEYNIDVAEYNDKDDHWSESKLGVAAITEPLEAQAAALKNMIIVALTRSWLQVLPSNTGTRYPALLWCPI